MLECKGQDIRQVDEDDDNNCYVFISQRLAYKPSDAFIKAFRRFFTTCIAGDMEAMEL